MEHKGVVRNKFSMPKAFGLDAFQESSAAADPRGQITDDHLTDHRVKGYLEFITLFNQAHFNQVVQIIEILEIHPSRK